MSEKLREYAVLGVSRGGRYAVRHKASGELFCWRAVDAAGYTPEQLHAIQDEVRLLSDVRDDALLQYHDTIVHAPTNTLYLVSEHITWATLDDLASECRSTGKYVREGYIWYFLHEMARVCKLLHNFDFKILCKIASASSVYIDESGAVKINCFDLPPNDEKKWDIMQQLGGVLNELCYLRDVENMNLKEFRYSDDLKDIVDFLTDETNCDMKPDVILYHPTVLANLENTMSSKKLCDVLVSVDFVENIKDSSKCDSEKALQLHKTKDTIVKYNSTIGSPMYVNVSPKMLSVSDHDVSSVKTSLSPTLAALALELPGFVPRRQTIGSNALARYHNPKQISEQTLSNQWISRLIALREREETLNRRERDLISKEIVNSPKPKISNENMPRRNIFPDAKKVHFTPVNPFVESDESVTLTYYELENVDGDGYQVPRRQEYTSRKLADEINKFKYLDLEKATLDKRAAMDQWSQSSPNKQPKFTVPANPEKKAFNDITNRGYSMKKTPSKSSINSKTSNTSNGTKHSVSSFKSTLSSDSNKSRLSYQSCVTNGSRFSARLKNAEKNLEALPKPLTRQSMVPIFGKVDDVKKPKSRKSLLPFKTSFKFLSSKS